MQSTDAIRTPGPQQNITALRVGTKSEASGTLLWPLLLVEGQLEAMRGVILAGIVKKLFVGGRSLPA
jgi:hypothetical protein